MKFERAEGLWRVSFRSADLKTALRRKLTFSRDYKIVEMAEEGGASLALDDRQALEHGLAAGQGAVWLSLTPEHYGKLM